jgi:uncharacterized protein (TIGR03546 family)
MILWIFKLLCSVRRAIAGRKYPHQLAWAVALGLLLGVVPHGNLLALLLLLLLLSLKINHAMAGLTAVAVSFLASWLDPFSHQLGNFVLAHPRFNDVAANAWQLPLVPWTDLNNTVVMGSFLIGSAAVVPVFAIAYPMFRLLAPATSPDDGGGSELRELNRGDQSSTPHRVVLVDQGHAQVSGPHRGPEPVPHPGRVAINDASTDDVEFVEVDQPSQTRDTEDRIAVETRIDVIRMKDYRSGNVSSTSEEAAKQAQPMDEALNYLLRQLRDAQQRKAA